jgi:hypothetical protein
VCLAGLTLVTGFVVGKSRYFGVDLEKWLVALA